MIEEIAPAGSSGGSPPLKTLIEAFVLVSDGPVAKEILAQALAQEESVIEAALVELERDYATRGIRLQRMRDRVQFVSAPEVSEQVSRYLGLDTAPRLSPAALETLAIIAYRQPITRPQIESIRGVNCDGVVHTLLARNLIESMGELDTVGHPTLYGTTFDFMHYFGLTSLDQLPSLPEDMIPFLPAPVNEATGSQGVTREQADSTANSADGAPADDLSESSPASGSVEISPVEEAVDLPSGLVEN